MTADFADLSELEREFEYESGGAEGGDFEMEFEGEQDDNEFELDEEHESEQDDEFEVAFEANDFEAGIDDNLGASREHEFVERFMEISGREFESSYEAEAAMGEVLDDIEREYFFGAIKRGLKKLSKNKLLRSLAQKGMTFGVNKFLPGLKGALQLARGNLKGALVNFGKQALGSVVPGGGAIFDAAQSIGLAPREQEYGDQETWENYVTFAREAYEHMADNLTPNAHRPAEATRIANNAIQHAIAKAQARNLSGGYQPAPRQRGTGTRRPNRVVRLRVNPGERIKLLITGA